VADFHRLPEHSSNDFFTTLTDYPGLIPKSNILGSVVKPIVIFVVSALALAGQDAGLPNFQQLNEHIFRGGQPSDDGFKKLAGKGVKTVVDLRWLDEHDIPREKQTVESDGMRFVSVPMKGLSAPSLDQLSKVFSVLDDSASWPVFIHCRRGADRTGTVLACYRIAHDHWQNQKALEEAKTYGLSVFEPAMRRFIARFQPSLFLGIATP
jgi:protein tyrosine/serine phosphatase